MTDFETIQVAVGALQVLVAAVGVFFLVRTLRANVDAIDESRVANQLAQRSADHHFIQNRAWLKLGLRLEAMEVRGESLYCRAVLSTTNVGLSVASGVKLAMKLCHGDAVVEKDQFAKLASKMLERPDYEQLVIYPSGADESIFNLYLPLVRERSDGKVHKFDKVIPFVVAAVSYQVVGDDCDHLVTEHAVIGKYEGHESSKPIDLNNFNSEDYELRTRFHADLVT